MKKEKVYIAGPITGLPRKKVMKAFFKAEKWLTSLGYEVINPLKVVGSFDVSWDAAMSLCIPALKECTAACFLPEFEVSKGAMIEFEIAKENGLRIMYFKNKRQ